jgi:ABC-type multidrug transport system permease subunit
MSTAQSTYPVTFDIAYPERMSRWRIFQPLLLFPTMVLAYVIAGIPSTMAVGFWLLIVFTGRIPKWMFDASVNTLRWTSRLCAYALLLTDHYPSLEGEHPVSFDAEFEARPGRLGTFFRIILVIPHLIVLSVLWIAFAVTNFIAWWAILIVGRYPRGLHQFGVGVLRWGTRVNAYMLLMRDEYPPFSLAP